MLMEIATHTIQLIFQIGRFLNPFSTQPMEIDHMSHLIISIKEILYKHDSIK